MINTRLQCINLLLGTTLTEWDKLPSIKVGDFTLEVEFGPPGKELQEIAKNELRETPELQKDAIARLRELLKGDKIIIDCRCKIKIEEKKKKPQFSTILISFFFLSFPLSFLNSRDRFEMPRGERRLADPISQALQVLSGIGVESG